MWEGEEQGSSEQWHATPTLKPEAEDGSSHPLYPLAQSPQNSLVGTNWKALEILSTLLEIPTSHDPDSYPWFFKGRQMIMTGWSQFTACLRVEFDPPKLPNSWPISYTGRSSTISLTPKELNISFYNTGILIPFITLCQDYILFV